MNRHFTKVNRYLVNKYMKTYSIALVISEVQTKIIMTYYYIPIRMTKIKFLKIWHYQILARMKSNWNSYIAGGIEK